MTLEELFLHFKSHFDKIVSFDATNNIQDTIIIKGYDDTYNDEEYNNFLDDYGEYFVEDWEYSALSNRIDISIKSTKG